MELFVNGEVELKNVLGLKECPYKVVNGAIPMMDLSWMQNETMHTPNQFVSLENNCNTKIQCQIN